MKFKKNSVFYFRWNNLQKKMRQYCLLKNMMKKGEQQRSRSKD